MTGDLESGFRLDQVCRTCLGRHSTMKNIFTPEQAEENNEKTSYHQMITACTGLQVKENDGLPGQVCVECAAQVQQLFSFRAKCCSTDACLRRLLRSAPSCPDSEGDESVVLFVDTDDSSVSNDFSLHFDRQRLSKFSSPNSDAGPVRPPAEATARKTRKSNNGRNNNLRIVAINKRLVAGTGGALALSSMMKGIAREKTENEKLGDSENKRLKYKRPRKPGLMVTFNCRKCDQHYLTFKDLADHNSSHSESSLEPVCRICGKSFPHVRHVNPHIRRDHAGVDRLECGYCNKCFPNMRQLRAHITIHALKPPEKEEKPEIQSIKAESDALQIDNDQKLTQEEESNSDITCDDKTQDKSLNGFFEEKTEPPTSPSKEKKTKMADTLICYACKQLFLDLEALQAHLFDVHMMDDGSSDNVQSKDITSTLQEVTSHSETKDDSDVQDKFCGATLLGNDDEKKPVRDASIGLQEGSFDDAPSADQPSEENNSLEGEETEECSKKRKGNRKISKESDECKSNETTEDGKGSKKGKHSCDLCGKCFRSANDLRRHEASHDPDKPFYCQAGRCKWAFATEHELLVHTNVNHTGGDHDCCFCDKSFQDARNLRQHMLQHRPTKRFTCRHCHKGFNHLHHVQNHERVHTGDLPFLCQECGRTFATKDRLTFHIRRHSSDRPYPCNKCTKKFVSSTDLRIHLKIHTGERPHMCSVCGKTFTARYNLNKHARGQHNGAGAGVGDGAEGDSGGLDTCDICGTVAKTPQLLNKHMKVHTCQYFCPQCSKGFPVTSALEAHIKTHSMGDRGHVCSVCSAAFNRAEHLRGHMARRHNPNKPLTCSLCPRTFARAPDLAAHRRTHTGERPFVCTDCGRGFTQSGALRVHMRVHSGERPYICGVCHRAHRSAGALSAHMRTHCSLEPKTHTATETTIIMGNPTLLVESSLTLQEMIEPQVILLTVQVPDDQPLPTVQDFIQQQHQLLSIEEITEEDHIVNIPMNDDEDESIGRCQDILDDKESLSLGLEQLIGGNEGLQMDEHEKDVNEGLVFEDSNLPREMAQW